MKWVGLENIVLQSHKETRAATFRPHPVFFTPSHIEPDLTFPVSDVKSSSSRKRKNKLSYAPTSEDDSFWKIWKKKKALEASLLQLLSQQNEYLSSKKQSADQNSPSHIFSHRSEGDWLLSQEIAKVFEQFQQFYVLEKTEIIQLVSNFYRDLFGESDKFMSSGDNAAVKNGSSQSGRIDPSAYWSRTNSTVFRPIGEHNIYAGFDNIKKYYYKNVPLTTVKVVPIITDFYVHFLGNVAVVTNEFLMTNSEKSPSDQSNQKIDINDHRSRKNAKRLDVPFYATTILVKSQNNER